MTDDASFRSVAGAQRSDSSISTSLELNSPRFRSVNGNQGEIQLRDQLIKAEERAVRSLKALVIVAVIACAASVCVAIYMIAHHSDIRDFELEVSSSLNFHPVNVSQAN
jgi:hypothetical protein